ncbi:hypothetical protein ASD00_30515 [Ensifer sp. Root31]|nr:hypothetical protein ASD00_30515 [Ensifer sp. Root31]KQW78576.1 hypothetical protein ASD03_26205 [Ensifer sp. Root127]
MQQQCSIAAVDKSPSLFSHPEHVTVAVAALLATHASSKCQDRLRRAKPTRQVVPIQVMFSAAAFALAEKLTPFR